MINDMTLRDPLDKGLGWQPKRWDQSAGKGTGRKRRLGITPARVEPKKPSERRRVADAPWTNKPTEAAMPLLAPPPRHRASLAQTLPRHGEEKRDRGAGIRRGARNDSGISRRRPGKPNFKSKSKSASVLQPRKHEPNIPETLPSTTDKTVKSWPTQHSRRTRPDT